MLYLIIAILLIGLVAGFFAFVAGSVISAFLAIIFFSILAKLIKEKII